MQTGEIWRTTKIDPAYEISNTGNLRSVDHYGYTRHRKSLRLFKGHPIKGEITNKVRYSLHGKKKYMAHVLVAQAFPEICGVWFEGCHVHHKDLNPMNNNAENLICLTEEEHFALHTAMGKNQGEKNPWFGKHMSKKQIQKMSRKKKKPIIQLDIRGEELMCWFSVTDCQRETGMDKSTINRVCLGKQHTAYGYKWRYA